MLQHKASTNVIGSTSLPVDLTPLTFAALKVQGVIAALAWREVVELSRLSCNVSVPRVR